MQRRLERLQSVGRLLRGPEGEESKLSWWEVDVALDKLL